MVVFSPAGEAAMTIALRPLIAIIALFTGVAPGLVDGVMAATTPTGLAYLTMPRFLSSSTMPTDFTRMRSRSVPKVLPENTLAQIAHFFQHYKDLEPQKWVRLADWVGPKEAKKEILDSATRFEKAARSRAT